MMPADPSLGERLAQAAANTATGVLIALAIIFAALG